jgi:predicted Zn-dependent protease
LEFILSYQRLVVFASRKLGLILPNANRPIDAERICRAVLARNPRHAPSLARLGQMALHTVRLDDAVNLLRKAVAAEIEPPGEREAAD